MKKLIGISFLSVGDLFRDPDKGDAVWIVTSRYPEDRGPGGTSACRCDMAETTSYVWGASNPVVEHVGTGKLVSYVRVNELFA